jgi:hypothetical protein
MAEGAGAGEVVGREDRPASLSEALTEHYRRAHPEAPTCDILAGPEGAQFVDLGIYASWWTNLRTKKFWQMISG